MVARPFGLSLLAHAVVFAALPEGSTAHSTARSSPRAELVVIAVTTHSFERTSSAPHPLASARTLGARTTRRRANEPLTPVPARVPAPEAPCAARAVLDPGVAEPSRDPIDAQQSGQPSGERDQAPALAVGGASYEVEPNAREPNALNPERVRSAIDRHLVYPLRARRMGWSGRVLLAVELSALGELDQVRVMASSGFGALDEAAVESVRRAAPFEAPGRPVQLVVPVSFDLRRR